MPTSPLPRMSRRGRATIGVLIGVFIVFTLLGWGVELWTDWLWFEEVRYQAVFTGVWATRVLLFLAAGLAMALLVGANLWLAYRWRPLLRPHSVEQVALDRYRMVLTPRIRLWFVAITTLVGLFAGMSAQARWGQWLLFRNAQEFGVVDPEFQTDVGFYVFRLPFLQYLLGLGFTAVVLSLIGALAVHYLFGGVRLQGAGDRITNAARIQLTSLVAVFVLLKAVAYLLDRRTLLLERTEATAVHFYGAGYSTVNALLPAKEILAYISVVVAVAILVFSNSRMRNLVWAGVSLALLGISAVAIGGIYPWAVQTFEVRPSAKDKEALYIERSIEATRDAFGLTGARTMQYAAANLIPPETLATDTTVVDRIRVIDPQVVSETFTALQQVRSFYDFGQKLDVDRYTVNGKTQDHVVGIREINYAELTDQQANWINRHTVYTHGYGLVSAPANKVVCGGQPLFVSGFLGDEAQERCSSEAELIPAEQPRVYFGEQMRPDDYAIVGQTDPNRHVEFDRPNSGEQNYTYEGTGGVEIGSFGRRLLFALKEQEPNFLLSDAVNENSKLLYVRNPRDRVEKVAPFLTLDGDPYPAIVDGRIVWIVDGYTTAATYPYAERINLQSETRDELTGAGTFRLERKDVNYIRNSVKATVDAYDGTVRLYEFDADDPVLKAWNQAFGGDLVIPKEQTPPELVQHFRYPSDLFKVQRNLLTRFHVDNPSQFFSGDDFWKVPNTPHNPDKGERQPPYYLYTQLPGQDEPRFQITSAVTPAGRENLAALISGSYVDGEPRLEMLELPDQTVIPGPVQVHQKMTNNGDIRQQLSYLTADGQAEVEYGNLLSLPFGDGMLYVEPVYVKTKQQNAYPVLQRVLLSYGEGGAFVVLANSIEEGIRELVEQGKKAAEGQPPQPEPEPRPEPQPEPQPTPSQPPVLSDDLAAAAAKVQAAIAEVKAAQASGDFERYGRALKALEDAMNEFQAAQRAVSGDPVGVESSPSPDRTG
ncbi:MAG TPA: UPF0182 family protein [Micromonosporaceae bacterium]